MYTLKITIKSLNNIKIEYLYKIKQFLKNNIKIKGNIQQKKKKTIYTVLKSPHVNKKSMEHFNYNFYKKNFYILNNNFYILIYFLIILKKSLPENILIKTQIIKN